MTGSWVDVPDSSGFTLANLAYGSFSTDVDRRRRLGVAIGDHVLDLAAVAAADLLPADLTAAAAAPDLDALLALDRRRWRALRAVLTEALAEGSPTRDRLRTMLVPLSAATMHLPFTVGDYVDFYSSIEHATNLGRLLRPGQDPLLPNWRHLPVGYHGRSSTVVVSGTPIVRPVGQVKGPGDPSPRLAPTEMLDFELEVGFVTGGPATALGARVDVDDAEGLVFGLVLVNDWSARDIQAWEYQPLGPFLAKSFATSISPWVVPLEALEPFRVAAPPQDPPPLGYLVEARRRGVDLHLRARLDDDVVATTNFRSMYWTIAQQLAHMTVNGSVVRPGDLYASGTVSGSRPGEQGSLMELTERGARPLHLSGGRVRAFLEDGDTITIDGWCGEGSARVGFGQVSGTVLPAR